MAITASACSICGLISLTRKLAKRYELHQINRPLEIFVRDNVDDLWKLMSSRPPTAYRSSSAFSLLKARFAAAYERFSARTIINAADSNVPSEWRAAAYTARKQLREASLSRRRRRKLHEL